MVTDPLASDFDPIPFRIHPRVFAALGADLVTNDVVAVIELVKNSYDAFASNVWIRFKTDLEEGPFIEIEDDGQGMSKEIIEDVWCVVATPHKEKNPYARSGGKRRRVAGKKGLGRLSAGRLGESLQVLTQPTGQACWEVKVSWSDLAGHTALSSCIAQLRRYPKESPFNVSGTRLRIFGLTLPWDASKVADLEDNLTRLISPFAAVGTFNIFLVGPDSSGAAPLSIQPPEFLNAPKYVILGEADSGGKVIAEYRFDPIRDGKGRTKRVSLTWQQAYDSMKERWQSLGRKRFLFDEKGPKCGQFSFEIRAWDIDPEGTKEIQDRFDYQKSKVRRAIRAHKGISVYRDGILILPKSETSRDWLGLDLRRVSRVGGRLSTNQIVGYVALTAANNPDIEDTSDRERLVDNLAVAQFEEILITVVQLLENERDGDRSQKPPSQPLVELFSRLHADSVVSETEEIVQSEGPASDVLPLLKQFNDELKTTAKELQQRFTFYSQMATVGTIAQILVHEIRNRTTSFGHFVRMVRDRLGPLKDPDVAEAATWAEEAIHSLENLADTFAPLASRSFRRRIRDSVVEERIRACFELLRGDFRKKKVDCTFPEGKTRVAMDPGELDAVVLNLMTNSLYWLGSVNDKHGKLLFQLEKIDRGSRVRVWAHDNGPGVAKEDAPKIFDPGFTRKPGGIGMGLTVASELVREYGGQMQISSGKLGGASFGFDLPARKD
ncbi:MAG: sensor histidine kinase [Nitrospirae bacterium]|nr:sensor histidine kinase [Nitrospirota bacterium]